MPKPLGGYVDGASMIEVTGPPLPALPLMVSPLVIWLPLYGRAAPGAFRIQRAAALWVMQDVLATYVVGIPSVYLSDASGMHCETEVVGKDNCTESAH